ncbi:hypothetical protein QAD02_003655 [Eretmocerus hayati]|uniref:Uncharacterized protein n=1 Tax=Eretmocerus hayati TaxID=131215 RepID=A0ACC2NMN4_9HYME|nr:hypothetical protein QAD02_003655 [Eretmocerus hayati]
MNELSDSAMCNNHCSFVQVDNNEQAAKLEEIVKILVSVGYYRARITGLTSFDKKYICDIGMRTTITMSHNAIVSVTIDIVKPDYCKRYVYKWNTRENLIQVKDLPYK